MNWILVATLLLGATAAVIVISLLIRYASRRQLEEERITEPAPQRPARATQIVKPQRSDPPTPPSTELQVDKNVQFTVYRPNTIVPSKWYPLVAFAHLSKRRADAPKDEPDPVEEVRRQAARVLSDQPAQYESAKLDRGFSVPRKGLLTFVPLIEGCEFNPPTQSILWQKTVHKVEFEMSASAEVDGRDVEGQMTVYLGNIVLTEIPLRINVDSQYVSATAEPAAFEEANAEPYRKIFASYSHQDTEIVEDFEAYVQALGDQYLRDVQTLRSGEVWSEALERMIREATVFQLFWSSNSMRSQFVKQEWEYALALNKPGFIRPVYWEEPLPQLSQDLPPAELRRLHFYKFPETIVSDPTSVDLTARPPIDPLPEQHPKTIYCRNCGAANDGASQFCANCGATIDYTGDNQPRISWTQSASTTMTGDQAQAMPKPASVQSGPRRSVVPMKSLLALISFVAFGSVTYTLFMTTRSRPSGPSSEPPKLILGVATTGRLKSKGDTCEYSIVVRNTSAAIIRDVRITERLPADLEYLTSDPEPITREGPQAIVWAIAEIPRNQTVMIRINVRLLRDLNGEKVTTNQTASYKDDRGEEQTTNFSLEPIIAP
jgi:uncharacterized repeat protein (TIGR01451 family)